MSGQSVRFAASGLELPLGAAVRHSVPAADLQGWKSRDWAGAGWQWTREPGAPAWERVFGATPRPSVEVVEWPGRDLDIVPARDQVAIYAGFGCDGDRGALWPAMVGLPELYALRDVPVRDLSPLENLWTHVATALVREPDLIVLAFPWALLGAGERDRLLRRLNVLVQNSGIGVLLVSDSPEFADHAA